jgi:hypothetical protein
MCNSLISHSDRVTDPDPTKIIAAVRRGHQALGSIHKGDDAAHIAGRNLGGTSATYNLTPLNPALNRGPMRVIEQLAKKYGGQIVSKPRFVGKEMRSNTLEYTVRFANP